MPDITPQVARAGAIAPPIARSRVPGQAAALGIFLLTLLVIPLAIGDQFVSHVFITIFIFAGLSTAWNIVGGYAGQISLGHAIFYGIGAYAGVILMNMGLSPWIGMILGAIVAVLAAVTISYPCFRLRGPFFSLATIAFLEVFRVLALHFRELTGGATGLMIPLKFGWQWMVFRDRTPALLIAFGLLAVTLAVAWRIRSHRLGFYLIAARERESAAQAANVNTVKVRLIAVSASAALTALIGTFHAMYLTFIDPAAVFSLTLSIQIAMFALIGGLGAIFGPLLGAVFLVPLSEFARGWLGAQALGLHGFVYGVALILVVLFAPNGLTGILARYGGAGRRVCPIRDKSTLADKTTPARAAFPQQPQTPTRTQPGKAILAVERLNKRFGGLHVAREVSFSLKEGEILGLIGPNGAGKTTVFNMLSGFLKPDSGSVTVQAADGSWQKPVTPGDFATIGVGRTFQIVQPFAAMTVEENIMVGAFHRHRNVNDAREAARETAFQMGLDQWLDAEARGLPIGGLKRLEVARVMAMQPRILLLDEVMAGIHQTDVRRAIELILSIRNGGVSIIAIEHVMQAVMSLSDRVIVLNSGQIIAEGNPQDVVRDPQVIEAYLGKGFNHAQA